jgi:TRAP-type C4-dicarboxylate transport system substrate-binding protein
MGVEWAQATGDELRLRIYAGGTVGDESEMIRKMRIGQLQAAAISNAGLAEIDPGAYALMLPMMFASYDEWDHVRERVNPLLQEKLKEKGFVVLAWSDVGWVYFFTKSPMRSPADLMGMKLAGSHTESRTIDIFKWAGFNPVPISTVDMMTGLQTGLIDSLYLPIILAEGSQYYRQAPHMTDMKWAPLQGAVVMHEKGWASLTADQKADVLRITVRVGQEMRASNRDQEARSLQAMKSRGLNVVPVSADLVTQWTETVKKAYPRVRGNLVPPEIFDEVERLRDEYRKNAASPR